MHTMFERNGGNSVAVATVIYRKCLADEAVTDAEYVLDRSGR